MEKQKEISDALWERYKSTGDIQARNEIATQYIPLVEWIAYKIYNNTSKEFEMDDLIGYGTIGLIDAIDRFDITRGYKFKTYAVTRIRGAIYNELIATAVLPQNIQRTKKKMRTAIKKLETQLDRKPTDDELKEALGNPPEYAFKNWKHDYDINVISVDHSETLCNYQSSYRTEPDYITEKNIFAEQLQEILSTLPTKNSAILKLVFWEGMSQKDIAYVLKMHPTNVSQIKTKSLKMLKEKLKHYENYL